MFEMERVDAPGNYTGAFFLWENNECDDIIKGKFVKGDDKMTDSELQCTNILINYFFKEFVYRDLYVYAGKQKQELCDGLVEFQDAYVIFQIKEKNGSTAQDWLQKKVYKKAVSQIKDTISKIRNGNIIEVEWVLLSFENEHNEQYEKILEEEKLWSNIKQLRLY